jgi:hypothetical protein
MRVFSLLLVSLALLIATVSPISVDARLREGECEGELIEIESIIDK